MKKDLSERAEPQEVVRSLTPSITVPGLRNRLLRILVSNNLNCSDVFATALRPSAYDATRARQSLYFFFYYRLDTAARMDSDLDAFSLYPTDVSFTALAFQPTVFTNYPEKPFLSY